MGGGGSCRCQDWHGCIMRPSVIGDEGIQPYKFSTCSADQFQTWMGEGHALCLLNKPNQIAEFGSCGNGIVDEGEDCDCGSQVVKREKRRKKYIRIRIANCLLSS